MELFLVVHTEHIILHGRILAYGHVHVTAETKEAAIEYALGPECPLPPGDYVTDSVAVDEDIEVEEE